MIKSSKPRVSVLPVILCGGSGTRLWPLSRTGFPKQFLSLNSTESLFQQAAQRLMALDSDNVHVLSPVIVTGEDHRFLALEQLREIGIDLGQALLEPLARNTAPALTFGALAAMESGEDPIMVVTPADQTVGKVAAFNSSVLLAIEEAERGSIVVLGVAADRPETGYGYIKIGKTENDSEISPVKAFVEKPDVKTAEIYLKEGGYFWNAGMFVLKASVWLKALEEFRPDILKSSYLSWNKRISDAKFVRPGKVEFADIPAESIDFAVMERCPKSAFPIKMVPLNACWNDLGAWDAVWDALSKDADGNACRGDVITSNSCNSLVHASSRLVALVGVQDLVVVETPDAILVASKSQSQDVKKIVSELEQQQRQEQVLHRKVHRPWGWFDEIDEGERFKVKRIQVKPKASLSLQKHHHRAEHWIVVKGTAEITVGENVITLTENQSTYIPLGEVHRLTNPGSIPLEIIEVQSGSYLGEDDIVRLIDVYGRVK